MSKRSNQRPHFVFWKVYKYKVFHFWLSPKSWEVKNFKKIQKICLPRTSECCLLMSQYCPFSRSGQCSLQWVASASVLSRSSAWSIVWKWCSLVSCSQVVVCRPDGISSGPSAVPGLGPSPHTAGGPRADWWPSCSRLDPSYRTKHTGKMENNSRWGVSTRCLRKFGCCIGKSFITQKK